MPAVTDIIAPTASKFGVSYAKPEDTNYLSYSKLLGDRKRFRSIHTNDNHQSLDEPGTYYFKIMFYFNNQQNESGMESNLLGGDTGNTALHYLKDNGEVERYEYLRNFIHLLSDISANTPWYFQSVEGLDNTQDRSYLKEFKASETRQLVIKCLQDSIDNRITDMLEMYRAACFSHVWKKEIVPSNLRKFDMGIYIFQTPTNGLTYSTEDKKLPENGVVSRNKHGEENESTIFDPTFSSCKYLEFHNCEISLESLKSCYGTPDNSKGFAIEPSITIEYDDCYVSHYNEWLCKTIGDFVLIDIDRHADYTNDVPTMTTEESNSVSFIDKVIEKTVKNAGGRLTNKAKNIVTSAFIGNVYGLSVANVMQDVNSFIEGGDAATALSNTIKQGKNLTNAGKNIYEDARKELARLRGNTLDTGNDLGSVSNVQGYKPASNMQRLGNVAKKMIRNL